jgi:hypothetical protein
MTASSLLWPKKPRQISLCMIALLLCSPRGILIAQNDSPNVRPDSEESAPCQYETIDDSSFSSDSPFRLSAMVVGVLVVDEQAKCNGIIISPEYVLTPRHCVMRERLIDDKVTYVYSEHKKIELVLDDFKFGEGFVVGLNPKPSGVGDNGLDYVVLKVNSPTATRRRHFARIASSVRDKEDLYVVGAPGSNEAVKLNKTACHASNNISSEAMGFGYSCCVLDGSSGSAVFNFQNEIIGMHISGGAKDGTRFGNAILISKLVTSNQLLKTAMAAPNFPGSVDAASTSQNHLIDAYRLQDGRAFERGSKGWTLKTPRGDTRGLVLQDAASDVFLLWDAADDNLYLIPKAGGQAKKREGNDQAWISIGTITKSQ